MIYYIMNCMIEDQIIRHTSYCEDAITSQQPQKMVDNTSSIARLANRVLMVAKQESDNSEDPYFVERVNAAADQLQSSRPLVIFIFQFHSEILVPFCIIVPFFVRRYANGARCKIGRS